MANLSDPTQEMKSPSASALDINPLELFRIAKAEGRPLYTSAPMVRYSKLALRQTVAECGVDLTWTPMILAKEFNRSVTARDSEFSTCPSAPPTIAQFGASSPLELSRATTLIAPYVNGIDLNCGCPQSWACALSMGASLMTQPDLVCAMIRAAKAALAEAGYGETKTVSVKIRIHKDIEETVAFVRRVQEAGVDFITVHGRTRSMRSSEMVVLEGIRRVKEVAVVPVLANGDVFGWGDVRVCVQRTGVDGVMAARGMLMNPGLFMEEEECGENGDVDGEVCKWEVVERFLNRVVKAPVPLKLVVHHLSEMVGSDRKGGLVGGGVGTLFTKEERMGMMNCGNMLELIDYLDGIREVRRF